jgi:hypothetical protein
MDSLRVEPRPHPGGMGQDPVSGGRFVDRRSRSAATSDPEPSRGLQSRSGQPRRESDSSSWLHLRARQSLGLSGDGERTVRSATHWPLVHHHKGNDVADSIRGGYVSRPNGECSMFVRCTSGSGPAPSQNRSRRYQHDHTATRQGLSAYACIGSNALGLDKPVIGFWHAWAHPGCACLRLLTGATASS